MQKPSGNKGKRARPSPKTADSSPAAPKSGGKRGKKKKAVQDKQTKPEGSADSKDKTEPRRKVHPHTYQPSY